MAAVPQLPALIAGEVTHRRRRPVRHAFRHRAYQWLVDLDDIPVQRWYLRPLASFSSADHLGDPRRTIKQNGDGLERDRTEIVFPRPMAALMTAARLVPPRLWTTLWARPTGRTTVQIRRTVAVAKPLDTVFDYLSDFTTTTEWDPGTVATVRSSGDGGVGTEYLNTSRFLGRTTELRYVVQEFVASRRIRLRGENATVVADDTMTFTPLDGGTEVTYTAEFAFKGVSKYLAPLLRPALRRLGERAETGLRRALGALPDQSPPVHGVRPHETGR